MVLEGYISEHIYALDDRTMAMGCESDNLGL